MLIIACVCAYTVDSQQNLLHTMPLFSACHHSGAAWVWSLATNEVKLKVDTTYEVVWLYVWNGKGHSVVTKRDQCCTLLSFKNYLKGHLWFDGMWKNLMWFKEFFEKVKI